MAGNAQRRNTKEYIRNVGSVIIPGILNGIALRITANNKVDRAVGPAAAAGADQVGGNCVEWDVILHCIVEILMQGVAAWNRDIPTCRRVAHQLAKPESPAIDEIVAVQQAIDQTLLLV